MSARIDLKLHVWNEDHGPSLEGEKGTPVYVTDNAGNPLKYYYLYINEANNKPTRTPLEISETTLIYVHAATDFEKAPVLFSCVIEGLGIEWTSNGKLKPISKLAFFHIVDTTTFKPGHQIPVGRLYSPEQDNFKVTQTDGSLLKIQCCPDDIKLVKLTTFVLFDDKKVIIPCDPEFDNEGDRW